MIDGRILTRRRSPVRLLLLLAAVSTALFGLAPGGRAAQIVPGSDGNLWFTRIGGDAIGRITPTGTVSWVARGGVAGATSIVAGADGNLWFAEFGGRRRIGRVTTTGVVTYFPSGQAKGTQIGDLIAGPDGDLWGVAYTRDRGEIVRINSAGVVTPLGRKPDASQPHALASGPDGVLWFHDEKTSRLGRVASDGGVTMLPGRILAPLEMVSSGGALWISYPLGLLRIDGSGARARVAQLPATVISIAAGPDGGLWVAFDDNRLGRVSPAGRVRVFPRRHYGPFGMVTGPDGNLWGVGLGRILRVTPAGVVSEFPPTAVIAGTRVLARRTIVVRVVCPPGSAGRCRGTLVLSCRAHPGGRMPRRPIGRFTIAPGAQRVVRFGLPPVCRSRAAAVLIETSVVPAPSPGSAAIPGYAIPNVDLLPSSED